MKIGFICLVFAGLAGIFSVNAIPRHHQRTLHEDLEDFLALIPKDEIAEIFFEYLKHDAQVQYVVEYVQTSEFRELVKAMESIPDVVNFYNYLQESGLDVYELVNRLHEYIGLPPLVPPTRSLIAITGGVAGLIADVKAVLPIDDIKTLYYKKLETSVEFKNLVERLQSPKFQAVVDTLRANPEFQEIVKKGKAVGVDVKAIVDLLSTVLGLQFPEHNVIKMLRGLNEDFEDFLALVPKDKIAEIFLEYLKHDAQVQYVVEYVQTPEFRELVKGMESIPDVANFYNYLQESGLDVYELVNRLHEYIGLPPLVPPTRSLIAITGGVAGLIADVEAVLPIDDIKTLYYKKLETSVEFKNLVERLQSPKFQAVVDTLRANPEFQEIVKKAKAVGVDVKAIVDLLSTVLGLQFPEHNVIKMLRGLNEDLEDFLALVPKDKIAEIFLEYLKHDAQVQYVVEYVQTQEFRELVKVMESIPDVVNFYNYLQESGLDVYELVNRLHEFIGLPPLVPPTRSLIAITGGVAGLIADVKAVLPIDDIKTLYYKKLETSVEFKNLVERLQSPKFQAVVDTLRANPEFQEIVKKGKAVGVDVKAIVDLLSTVLGLQFPEHNVIKMLRGLNEDFEDFLALVPKDKIAEIFLEYLKHDAQVQYVVEYVQTPEFRELVKGMESIPDVVNFYNYLQESGLDVYNLVNRLHESIGLPPLVPPTRSFIAITGGVAGLIADVKAVLPIDDIKTLYYKKLETSVEFKILVGRLQSPKFQAVVDKLRANSEFQKIVKKAKEVGVDVKAITDLLSTVLGLEFPSTNSLVWTNTAHFEFDDFLDLPFAEVDKVLEQYLNNDEEIILLIQYFKTEEFSTIIDSIDHIPNVRYMYQYLDESGLDIYRIVNNLRRVINLPGFQPRKMSIEVAGGLRGLLTDIRRVFPIREFIALHREKMQNDPIYKVFVSRIHSQQFKDIVEAVTSNNDFKKAAAELQVNGFDVEYVMQLVDYLLNFHGLKSLERSLEGDFNDFIHLLPVDDIAKITFRYILQDPQVQEAARYIRSQELKNLAITLQNDPDVHECLKYFEDSGAHIIRLINTLNELLDFPPFPFPENLVKNRDNMSGVQGMLNEIRAVMPHDKIEAMFNCKMTNSYEFCYLNERIQDPAFQTIIDKLVVNENILELGYQAHLHGININTIAEFLTEIFGIQLPESPFPPNSRAVKEKNNLADDFADFFKLLPIDDIVELAADYILHDEEMQKVFIYIRSEQFKDIISNLHKIPEYKQILEKLEAAGVDVHSVIKILDEIIGYEEFFKSHHLSSAQSRRAIEKPGLTGFIEAVSRLLPYREIKKLYHDKLKASEAFAEFIGLISSEIFQGLTNKLFENRDFQDLLHEAQAHGIDLQSISDFFLRIFGIKTPPGIIDY